ncbi:MAG: hypothetical protein U5R46_16580 [Gammaproteobacteria bacterium]|nr:hypothetical protein [Gammaproteobacteria bacterium]
MTAGAVALLYALLYIAVYRTTALGQVGVLDEAENIRLAQALLAGEYPWSSPRLYPFVLALGGLISEKDFILKLFAQAMNAGFHAVNAALVVALAREVWGDRRWALAAGLLWALFPVAVYFTGETLDTTFSICLLLGALFAFVRTLGARARPRHAVLCALLALALWFARPQLALIAPALVAYWIVVHAWDPLRRFLAAGTAGLAAAALAIWAFSGAVSLAPSQTGYSLWAAHGPEANGLYFQQSRDIVNRGQGTNPAAAEGYIRYLRIHPEADTPEPSTVSRYWVARTLDHIRTQPGAWLQLSAHKALAALADWEPYNNKTYAFHKQRSPVLRYNPLSFSLIFSLAVLAAVLAGRAYLPRAFVLAAATVWFSVILTFASARFRLPLTAILTVLAAGAPQLWYSDYAARRRIAAGAAAGAAVLLSLLYPVFVERPSTHTEDLLLIASANLKLDRIEPADRAVEQALALRPQYPKALAAHCSVQFARQMDVWAQQRGAVLPEAFEACETAAAHSPVSRWGYSVLLWRSGRTDRARSLWWSLYRSDSLERERALASLLFTNSISPSSSPRDRLQAMAADSPLLRLALLARENPGGRVDTRDERIEFYQWLFSAGKKNE